MALGRLRRPAALHHQPDADDHVLVRALRASCAAETGLDPGWRGVGGLRLATTPERVEELRRQAERRRPPTAWSSSCSSAGETRERLPLLDVDDVLAAAWLPGDGYLDPELLAQALAAGARGAGRRASSPASA